VLRDRRSPATTCETGEPPAGPVPRGGARSCRRGDRQSAGPVVALAPDRSVDADYGTLPYPV